MEWICGAERVKKAATAVKCFFIRGPNGESKFKQKLLFKINVNIKCNQLFRRQSEFEQTSE